MKITVKHYDYTYSLEIPDETNVSDLMDKFVDFVVFMTYPKNFIDEWILEKAEEIENEKSEK